MSEYTINVGQTIPLVQADESILPSVSDSLTINQATEVLQTNISQTIDFEQDILLPHIVVIVETISISEAVTNNLYFETILQFITCTEDIDSSETVQNTGVLQTISIVQTVNASCIYTRNIAGTLTLIDSQVGYLEEWATVDAIVQRITTINYPRGF